MKPSVDELCQLIDWVFNDLYQFVAYRELRRHPVNVNETEISDFNYRLIWKLAGYDGAPERAFDKQTNGGDWHAYVDDELISAASEALQNAWKSNYSKRCPTRLFGSNRNIMDSLGLSTKDASKFYSAASTKLNLDEKKWRKAIRKESKPPNVVKPDYVVYISPEDFENCIILTKTKTIRFQISKKATNQRALWIAIVEHCVGAGVRKPTCEFTRQEIEQILGKGVIGSKNIRTPVHRFNKLWKDAVACNADVLVLADRNCYQFQPLVVVEEDSQAAADRVLRRQSKTS